MKYYTAMLKNVFNMNYAPVDRFWLPGTEQFSVSLESLVSETKEIQL